ncbi:MAG: hypothetical protein ABSA70_01925 [Terriglobia bacterium]
MRESVAPRELDFPYYSLRDAFNSTLLLVGASPAPLDFIIAVRSASGRTVLSPSMTIASGEKLSVDLRMLLTELGADVNDDFAEGSVSIYFNGTIMPLAGQLTMSNPARSLVLESEMVDNSPGLGLLPSALNAVWWGLGGGREARIMVSNTSGDPVSADVYLDFQGERHESDPLAFAPHETKILSITHLLGQLKVSPAQAPEGGMSIIGRGSKAVLIAQGKITDPNTGFSTTLNFPDPKLQRASALHASGVPIGTPSKDSPFSGTGAFLPHVIVRNLTAAEQAVTITVEYPGEEGPAQAGLPPLTVGPYSTVDFSLDSVMGELPLPLPFCSIRIQYSGAPGSVIGEVSSIEAKGDLVIDSRLANERDGWVGSGAHPWHLDEETESILFLTNMSEQSARIGFDMVAGGVHYYLTRLKLKPHETRAIDLRKVRDEQKADLKGNKVPAGATDGSVVWIRLDHVPVMGRLVVLQRHRNMASNYDCYICDCPADYVGLDVFPSSWTILPEESALYDADAAFQEHCGGYGWWECVYPDSWTSLSPNVATIDEGGIATGQTGGTATIKAIYGDIFFTYDNYLMDCVWHLRIISAGGTCKVFTFTVNISPSTVAPLNAGTPNTTTVTVQTNPYAPNQTVTLQDVRVANTGGHLNHPLPNTNVSGTFNPSSGPTDSQGRFQSTYTVKEFGGEYQIKATIHGTTVTGPITLWVQIQGLGELSAGGNYAHVGQIPGIHEQNWFGTSSTRNGLVATANACAGDAKCKGLPVPYNDLSLPWGGKFDSNTGNWTTLHSEHRVGRNADINVCSPWGNQDRRDYLWQEFGDASVGGASARLDECSTKNCWHITW